ncbi:MAG: type IV pilus modification protein PilV [Methylohalobius sp. ZOD2]
MRREAGFTLIEILIAVLVLAIGLLGLAGLQTTGLHSNHSANLRTQATLLAYDMIDRIRANHDGYEGTFYNNPTPTDRSCVWDGSTPSACTPQQMAEHDIWEWQAAMAQALPQATGVVCLDSSPDDGGDANSNGTVEASEYACDNSGNRYAVKLWWVDEYDDSGNPVIKRFVTVFQP